MMQLVLILAFLLFGCGVTKPPTKKVWQIQGDGKMWRLQVQNHAGVFKTTSGLEQPISSFPRLLVEPDGNCSSGQIYAVPSGLSIGYRDTVTVELLQNNTWKSIWAGMALPENTESTLSGVAMVGLRERFRELEYTATSDVGGDVRAIFKRVVQNALAPDGLEGTLFTFASDMDTNIGFSLPAFANNYPTNAMKMLDELVLTVPGSTWGVNSKREVYFRIPTGTLTIDSAVEGTDIDFPDSPRREYVTNVRWRLGKAEISDITQAYKSIHHLSERAVRPYGRSTIDVELTKVGYLFKPMTATPLLLEGSSVSGWDLPEISDDSAATYVDVNPSSTGDVWIKYKPSVTTTVTGFKIDTDKQLPGLYAVVYQSVESPPGTFSGYQYELKSLVPLKNGFFIASPITLLQSSTVQTHIEIRAKDSGSSTTYRLFTLTPMVLDTVTLDNMAQGLYKIPVTNPTLAQIQGIVDPAISGTIKKRRLDGSIEKEYTLPITTLEYGITNEKGITTTINLGDADDPENIQRAELLNMVSRQARDSAIRFAGGN